MPKETAAHVRCVCWCASLCRVCRVDFVVLSTKYSPDYKSVFEMHNCDFCIHGDDINLNAEGKDPFAEVKALGKFRSIPRLDEISTTEIITRLLKATAKDLRLQQRTSEEED